MVKASAKAPVTGALAQGRQRLGLSLREVSRRLSESGGPISHSTLQRVEAGRVQLPAGELLRIARVYEMPEEDVLDLVEAERIGAPIPRGGSLEELVRRAEESFRRGDLAQGLGHVLALRKVQAFGPEQQTLLQRACLGFAYRAKDLGWVRLSRQLLEEILRAPVSPDFAARALIVASTLWWKLGSMTVAEAMLEKASRLIPPTDELFRGTVSHQRAKLLTEQKKYEEAQICLHAALRAYRRAGRDNDTMRAGILGVKILEGRGRVDAAIASARRVVQSTVETGARQLEAGIRIRLGTLLAVSGRPRSGIQELRQALGIARILQDAEREFEAQHGLWKVFVSTGERTEAAAALGAAADLLPRFDGIGSEADEIRDAVQAAPAGDPDRVLKRQPKAPIAEALERSRRRRGLSLREVARRLGETGAPISHSTLLRVEQGKLQPTAADLTRLASFYDIPYDEMLDLVEAGRIGAVVPRGGTLEQLVRRAEVFFDAGDAPQAIGHALAIRRMKPAGPGERVWFQRSLVGLAQRASDLGWLRLARRLLEEVLRDPVEQDTAARALVVSAALWQRSGAFVVAEAMVEKAERLIPRDDASFHASLQHRRAELLRAQHRDEEADRSLRAALRGYRLTKQPGAAMRARILRTKVLEDMDRRHEAMALARQTVREAKQGGDQRHEAIARMELGRLLVAAGLGDEGTRELRNALGLATILGDAETEFESQYHLWKASLATGDAGAARVALQSAGHLLTRFDGAGEKPDEIRRALAAIVLPRQGRAGRPKAGRS